MKIVNFKNTLSVLCFSVLFDLHSYPVFNDQLDVSTLGSSYVVDNQNISLQPTSQYSPFTPQQIRTNNFQTLQLKFGDYLTGRYPCRIGLFNISESSETVGSIPFGTMISLPAYTLAGDSSKNIPPNYFLQQIRDPSFWVFSFKEPLDLVEVDLTDSETGQVANVYYQSTNLMSYMKNINSPINAYHDIYYDEVTPVITLGKGRVKKIELDGAGVVFPLTSSSLIPCNKLKFTIENEPNDPKSEQIWLIYAQSDLKTTPLQLNIEYQVDSKGYLYNVSLKASAPYTGYLRVAAIQTQAPLSLSNCIRQQTAPSWELATQIQSIPSTPLAMFMLWPQHWVQRVGNQIIKNQATGDELSSYSTMSLLLPLLARTHYDTANDWYNQLIDKQSRGEVVFDIGTNSFVTLANILFAKYYDSEIKAYQAKFPRGVSTPKLSIQPSASTMEQMFDNHRSYVINAYDIIFNKDATYEYDISMLDVDVTFPQGAAVLPLLNFLGYQTLADGLNIINNATNKDPIKGDVNYAEGNIGSFPGSYYLKFKGQPLPSWSSRFIPDNFWKKLSGVDKTNLICQLNTVLSKELPSYSDDVYTQGKILFQLAMTAKYGLYVLLAQQNILPPYQRSLEVPISVKSKIQPVVKRIQELINTWLITHKHKGSEVSNYLVYDQTANGIVAIQGATSSTGGVSDSGNAVYTGHNRQYGYFLAAAGICIDIDNIFQNTRWIQKDLLTEIGFAASTKQFVDLLWRDYANPSVDDLNFMEFYRYGNSWEGMSSTKGMPPVGGFPSRNNESISEDFNGYYGAYLYASAIQSPFSGITSSSQVGFADLETFCYGNMNMIKTAAAALFYNSDNWVYKKTPFDFNTTAGTVWDNSVDMSVSFLKTYPASLFSQEGAIFSEYKFDLFCVDLINQLNTHTQEENQGCGCQK